MMAKFMTQPGERAMTEAIATIEQASSAEVVIVVRPHAHIWLVPATGLGIAGAAAALAYALFGEPEFTLWTIFWMPAIAGTALALLALLPPVYRLLLPDRIRDEHVVQAGRAAFLERTVHATQGRTGMLVYVSLLERRLLLVGDLEVERTLGDVVLDRWERELSDLIAKGAKPVGDALAAHAGEIGRALPHQADDKDELANAVITFAPRGLHRLRAAADRGKA